MKIKYSLLLAYIQSKAYFPKHKMDSYVEQEVAYQYVTFIFSLRCRECRFKSSHVKMDISIKPVDCHRSRVNIYWPGITVKLRIYVEQGMVWKQYFKCQRGLMKFKMYLEKVGTNPFAL